MRSMALRKKRRGPKNSANALSKLLNNVTPEQRQQVISGMGNIFNGNANLGNAGQMQNVLAGAGLTGPGGIQPQVPPSRVSNPATFLPAPAAPVTPALNLGGIQGTMGMQAPAPVPTLADTVNNMGTTAPAANTGGLPAVPGTGAATGGGAGATTGPGTATGTPASAVEAV